MKDVSKVDMSMAVYLADRFGPTLNPGIAHKLVAESPLHAWMAHPMLGGADADDTESTQDGSIIHELVFGGDGIGTLDHENFRSKDARESAEVARSLGLIPVLRHKLPEYSTAAAAIRRAIEHHGLVLDGESEPSFVWREDTRCGKVEVRCRMDHLRESHAQIIELKTIRDASLRSCQRAIHDHGYDIQMAAQMRAFARWKPPLAGRIDFVWVFAEIKPPYAVTPLRPCGSLKTIGERRWERAVERWAWCRKNNNWPGYVDRIETVQPLPWALTEELTADGANV